jgi:hypothetical protein
MGKCRRRIKMGHFEKGYWVEGVSTSLIGKKIIRTQPCNCGNEHKYLDYSYCINGLYGYQPDEWVILRDIIGGHLVIEWKPQIFPGEVSVEDLWWNDDYWIEVD